MFTKARLKLTAWYLLILLGVSTLFSVVLYRVMTLEVRQGYVQAESRLQARERVLGIPAPAQIRRDLLADFEDARDRVVKWLLLTNGFILVFSAGASFVLAGKTLEPIAATLEEQKRFVADASHELHTPLTALKTSIEVALREKKLSEKDARQILTSSLEEIDELAALNENLLSLARFEKAGSEISLSRVDISEVIRGVVKRMMPLARKKSIELTAATYEEMVDGNETNLSKLFTVLVDNAIKYTPSGGKVDITTQKKGKHVLIKVSDTGIGIAKDEVPHLFDRFYRADSSRTKEGVSGFGLGLAIAKRIVDLHHGTLSVQSKLGKGTTFSVVLPRSV